MVYGKAPHVLWIRKGSGPAAWCGCCSRPSPLDADDGLDIYT
jgi:hypothetical protein